MIDWELAFDVLVLIGALVCAAVTVDELRWSERRERPWKLIELGAWVGMAAAYAVQVVNQLAGGV